MSEQEGTGEVEALIHPGDDGKFWAEIVGLPGCYAQGDNYSKIMANLRDAHELCSAAPTSAAPASTPVPLEEGATAADLSAALATAGWAATGQPSEIHTLLHQATSGAILSIPVSPSEPLNSGYRAAVSKYLA